MPWEAIARSATDAIAATASEPRAHIKTRVHRILEELVSYAGRKGAPPHERIEVFGVVRSEPTLEEYRAAVALAEKKPKSSADAQHQHRIGLAAAFRQGGELLSLVQAAPTPAAFGHVLDAAKVLAARGELDAAWALVEPRLGDWWPVDLAQVAPVQLLTDPTLREVMTPGRAATVLATPRAQAAHPKR